MSQHKNKDIFAIRYNKGNQDLLYFMVKKHAENSFESVTKYVSSWDNPQIYSIVTDGQLNDKLKGIELEQIPDKSQRMGVSDFPYLQFLTAEPMMITMGHITYTNRVSSIMEHGLIPNKVDTFDYHQDGYIKKQSGVYLSNDTRFVERMFENEPLRVVYANKEDYQSGLTLLEVVVDASKLKRDTNAVKQQSGKSTYPCYLYDGVIHPENIRVVETVSQPMTDKEYDDEFNFTMEYHLRPVFESAYYSNYQTYPEPYVTHQETVLSEEDFLEILEDHDVQL